MNHLDQIIIPAVGFIYAGFWLCKVIDVQQARMQRIKRMRRAMDTMTEHNKLMSESYQARINAEK